MSCPSGPVDDPVAIARRILELDAEVSRRILAREYEAAAACRDERVALERRLAEIGDEALIRNVGNALGHTRPTPVIDMIEQGEVVEHAPFAEAIRSAPLPVRWVVHGATLSEAGGLRNRLDVDSLTSRYYQAKFPVISGRSLARARIPLELIEAVVRETGRSTRAVVWIVGELRKLHERGVLHAVVEHMHEPWAEFVACVDDADAELGKAIETLQGVSVLRV